jgi:hypothetical protein
VTNQKSESITLNERYFYKLGARAVSLETVNLAPHSRTYLYRVLSNAR